jgi:hypothetical protein
MHLLDLSEPQFNGQFSKKASAQIAPIRVSAEMTGRHCSEIAIRSRFHETCAASHRIMPFPPNLILSSLS